LEKKKKEANTFMKGLRIWVIIPALALLVATVVLSFINYDAFLDVTTKAKNFMVIDMGWVFNIMGVASILALILVYFTPLKDVRLGGPDAKPLLKKSTWFAITLCTTIAAGILFWGTAEPIYHLAYPPASLGIEPMSPEAAKFAMETMYLHWTFVPYALYALPTIVFGFAYYNMRRPFSVGSEIAPLIGEEKQLKANSIIDAIVLFTVATGISSSFGTAVLNMGGGLNAIFGLNNDKNLWVIITILGAIAFIISSGTGLMKGIKYLSDFNVYIYYVIIGALLLVGPTKYFMGLGTEAFGGFLDNFFSKAMFTGTAYGDAWGSDWTMFYWSNWMAWAPVSAVFLARIAYGYKIKEIIMMNLFIPGIFSVVWMTILSGTSINFQMTGRVDILSIMNEQGAGAAAYAILREFPLSGLFIFIYVLAVFISFITATDSTTNAMASISTSGMDDGTKEAPLSIKIMWGTVITVVTLVFLTTLGIDGIRMMSYLGGFPALFIGILSLISLVLMIKNHSKMDKVSKQSEKADSDDEEIA